MTTTWPLPDSPRNIASPAHWIRAFIVQTPAGKGASLAQAQGQYGITVLIAASQNHIDLHGPSVKLDAVYWHTS